MLDLPIVRTYQSGSCTCNKSNNGSLLPPTNLSKLQIKAHACSFGMYSKIGYLSIVCLSLMITSEICKGTVLQLPSNRSLQTFSANNRSLGGLPPRLPWRELLGEQSYLNVLSYGTLSAPYQHYKHDMLDRIARQISQEQGPRTKQSIYLESRMSLSMDRPVYRWEALKLIKIIKTYFRNERPVFLRAELQDFNEVEPWWHHVNVWFTWFDGITKWPDLPWVHDVLLKPGLGDLRMTFVGYGREIVPSSKSEMNTVLEALNQIAAELRYEGPVTGNISKNAYYHAFVKIYVEDPLHPPPDRTMVFSRAHMISLVQHLQYLFFWSRRLEPREFEAEVWTYSEDRERLLPGSRRLLTFTFMDPPDHQIGGSESTWNGSTSLRTTQRSTPLYQDASDAIS